MKTIIKYILLLTICSVSHASVLLETPMNIRNCSGATSLKEPGKYFNPALLSNINQNEAYLAVTPAMYLLPDLNRSRIFLGHRILENIVLGFDLAGTGNDLYSEINAAAAVSADVGKGITLGGQMTYGRISIKRFDAYNALQFSFGGAIDLTEQITAAFTLTNINRTTYEGYDNAVSQTAVFSLGYRFDERTSFDISHAIYLEYGSGTSFSARYKLLDNISVLLAYQTTPNMLEIGCMYAISKDISMVYRIDYNLDLGMVNTLSINYAW